MPSVGPLNMTIIEINKLLAEYGHCYLRNFDSKSCDLLLEFEADGGPYEVSNVKVTFHDARTFHLPRVFHAVIQLRQASIQEMSALIPSISYDKSDGGNCFLIQVKEQNTSYYVWAEKFSVKDIPEFHKP